MIAVCERCKKYGYVHLHHTYRRRNQPDITVKLCPDCHFFCHQNPAKAKVEGFYHELDSEYRPKKGTPDKWKLKKQVGF